MIKLLVYKYCRLIVSLTNLKVLWVQVELFVHRLEFPFGEFVLEWEFQNLQDYKIEPIHNPNQYQYNQQINRLILTLNHDHQLLNPRSNNNLFFIIFIS